VDDDANDETITDFQRETIGGFFGFIIGRAAGLADGAFAMEVCDPVAGKPAGEDKQAEKDIHGIGKQAGLQSESGEEKEQSAEEPSHGAVPS
jgi:hypothetical protein